MTTLGSMETAWRRERQELYRKLERSAENGLNRDAVLASRELFTFDSSGQAAPKQFNFHHEDDAVTVVCAEIPQVAAQAWGGITNEILQALTGDGAEKSATCASTNLTGVYVSDQDIMHVTLFYTSHPDDLAPRNADEHKSDRAAREITLLRGMATAFEPIQMSPVKVVLASSGAILLLLECLPDVPSDVRAAQSPANAGLHAEFSIDLLRRAAQQTFPFVSSKSPTAIIHTTLARVLDPNAFDAAALARVRAACHRISKQLQSSHSSAFTVDKLWYVDETHFIRPTGHTTTILLNKP